MKLDKKKILNLMLENGLNYADLADIAGLSYQGVRAAMRNNSVRIKTAKRLADALEVSPHEIVLMETEDE